MGIYRALRVDAQVAQVAAFCSFARAPRIEMATTAGSSLEIGRIMGLF